MGLLSGWFLGFARFLGVSGFFTPPEPPGHFEGWRAHQALHRFCCNAGGLGEEPTSSSSSSQPASAAAVAVQKPAVFTPWGAYGSSGSGAARSAGKAAKGKRSKPQVGLGSAQQALDRIGF